MRGTDHGACVGVPIVPVAASARSGGRVEPRAPPSPCAHLVSFSMSCITIARSSASSARQGGGEYLRRDACAARVAIRRASAQWGVVQVTRRVLRVVWYPWQSLRHRARRKHSPPRQRAKPENYKWCLVWREAIRFAVSQEGSQL